MSIVTTEAPIVLYPPRVHSGRLRSNMNRKVMVEAAIWAWSRRWLAFRVAMGKLI